LFYYFLKISLKKNKIFFNNLFAMSQCVCMVHPLKGVHVSFPIQLQSFFKRMSNRGLTKLK